MKKALFYILLVGSLFVVPVTMIAAGYHLQPQTGVVPTNGSYAFSGLAINASGSLTATGDLSVSNGTGAAKTVTFSPSVSVNGFGYSANYVMPVTNGEFHFQNGSLAGGNNDSGNTCPTEGFRLTGHFDTPYTASGSVSYVYACKIWKTVKFTAVHSSVPVLKTLTLSPSSISLNVGGITQQVTATKLDQYSNPITATITWASSNKAVATVSSIGLVKPISAGTANITASSGGIKSVPLVVTVTKLVLTTINVNPLSVGLAVGQTRQLTTDKLNQQGNPIAATLTWTSSNKAVVTVSSTGLVKAIAPGTANIAASSGSVKSASAVVTVANPFLVVKSITLFPSFVNLSVGGGSKQIAATVIHQFGVPIIATLTWNSSNPMVATVSSGGVVTPVAVGTTKITASNGGVRSAPAAVTVVNVVPVLKTITLSPLTTSNLIVGGYTQQITAKTLDQNGNQITTPLTWASSDTSVALVSTTGLVTALKPGTVNITASSGTVTSTAPASISAIRYYSLTTQTNVVPDIGFYAFSAGGSSFKVSTATTSARTITFYPQGYAGYTMSVTNGEFHYQNGIVGVDTSDNNNLNQYPTDGFRITGHFDTPVTASGRVDYVLNGKIQSSYDFTATADVARISITSVTTTLTVGQTVQFTFTAHAGSGTSVPGTVSWTSSDTSVVTVDPVGIVTATNPGTANITASNGGVTSAPTMVTVTANVPIGYSYTKVNAGNTVEHQFSFGQQHFMTVILDSNNAIAIRPHPGLDINGWGSSLYLQPFLPGATLRGTSIQSINTDVNGISFAISGVVSQGTSGSYGTFNGNLAFSYNPAQKKISGSGTYNVNLSAELSPATGDLNLYKLASNYLKDVPLLDGTTGDTGDMKYALVTGGIKWIPRNGSTYPQDSLNPISVEVVGDYNQVDTAKQGYAPIAATYKPSMTVVLSSAQTGLPLIFGGAYNASQSSQFWSDNVGITPLILKSSTVKSYNFNLTFDSTAIAGDH